jgi:dUTP pyrophosphatase
MVKTLTTIKLSTPEVKILLAPGAKAPEYATKYAAGADLFAYLPEGGIKLEPLKRVLVWVGFSMELPYGFEAQIRPRSGLAIKNGITVLNTPGTIDCDYRGSVGVILFNSDSFPFFIEHRMRIAQMVVSPVYKADFHPVDKLSETVRGSGGLGSTGVK